MDILKRITDILSEEELKQISSWNKDVLKKIYLLGAMDILR